MPIYQDFAHLYTSGKYPQYSGEMANLLPPILQKMKLKPKTLLDVACGEGTFAIAMANYGLSVTGIDQSEEMLNIAKEKARQANVQIEFIQMDMRQLNLPQSYDVVTCWYDSLNYLLTNKELQTTFSGIEQVLQTGGLFIFDMNTIHWLTTLAQRHPVTIERDINDVFQVHQHSFDYEQNIATFHLIGFVKENGSWVRLVDEIHKERGYTLEEIQACLQTAGLTEIACLGSLEKQTPVTKDSPRVYFITKK